MGEGEGYGSDIPMEHAGGADSYSEHLLSYLRAIDYYSVELRQAYIYGKENRDAHFRLISLLCQAWYQLFPKVMNNKELWHYFRKWKTVVHEPRLLLTKKYEDLIWLFIAHIRLAYEHLGLTDIE